VTAVGYVHAYPASLAVVSSGARPVIAVGAPYPLLSLLNLLACWLGPDDRAVPLMVFRRPHAAPIGGAGLLLGLGLRPLQRVLA